MRSPSAQLHVYPCKVHSESFFFIRVVAVRPEQISHELIERFLSTLIGQITILYYLDELLVVDAQNGCACVK